MWQRGHSAMDKRHRLLKNVITMDFETAKKVAATLNEEKLETYPREFYLPCEVEPDKWAILTWGNMRRSLSFELDDIPPARYGHCSLIKALPEHIETWIATHF